jgi:hypothetical protein
MPFKETFRTKQQLDRMAGEIEAGIKETTGQSKLNKKTVRNLLELTDFKPLRARDLELYVREPREGPPEVLVLDNDLPVYRTTVGDVAMRKTPYVGEMLHPRNILKILNDKDVVVSKGRESLRRIYGLAYSGLDLNYTDYEMDLLASEGGRALERRDQERVAEVLEVFAAVLHYQAIDLPGQPTVRGYARPRGKDEAVLLYEDLIRFERTRLRLTMVKGLFSTSEEELSKMLRREPDTEGEDVLDHLAGMAKSIEPSRRKEVIRPRYEEQRTREVARQV